MFDDLRENKNNPQDNKGSANQGNSSFVSSKKEESTQPSHQNNFGQAHSADTAIRPTNKPGRGNKLEDIFSETDKAPAKPPVLQPKETVAVTPGAGFPDEKKPKMLINKLFFLATLLIMIALFVSGAYWGYNYFFGENEEGPESEEFILDDGPKDDSEPVRIINNDNEAPEERQDQPGNTSPGINEPVTPIRPEPEPETVDTKDTDQDGLTDREELELGTNANNPDTDGDGLFDREEVEVYKTDPLSPDTDGDGYLDGAEVDAGYNPNGEGKLFKL